MAKLTSPTPLGLSLEPLIFSPFTYLQHVFTGWTGMLGAGKLFSDLPGGTRWGFCTQIKRQIQGTGKYTYAALQIEE